MLIILAVHTSILRLLPLLPSLPPSLLPPQLPVGACLMQVGADCKLRDKDGDSVLHFACMKEVPQGQHCKTLEFLLSKSLTSSLINTQNSRGDTPLLVAARQGSSESPLPPSLPSSLPHMSNTGLSSSDVSMWSG